MGSVAQVGREVHQVATISEGSEMASHGRGVQVEACGEGGNGCTAHAVAHLGVAPDDAVGCGCHKPARVADLVEERGKPAPFPLSFAYWPGVNRGTTTLAKFAGILFRHITSKPWVSKPVYPQLALFKCGASIAAADFTS